MAVSKGGREAGAFFRRWPEPGSPLVLSLKAKRAVKFEFVDAESMESVVGRGTSYQKIAAHQDEGEGDRYCQIDEFDADGWQHAGLQDGSVVSLDIAADGYESVICTHVVSLDEPVQRVELVPYSGIHGHVHDEAGNPIAGALVRVRPTYRGGCSVRTLADGSYRVATFKGRVRILVGCPPLYQRAAVDIQDGSGGTVDVRLKSAPVKILRGRLLTEEGMPAVGALVQLWREDAKQGGAEFSSRYGDPLNSTTSGIDGVFEFPNVSYGTYSVDGFAPGVTLSTTRSEVVPVRHHLLAGIVVSKEVAAQYFELRLNAIGEIEFTISEERLGSLVAQMPVGRLPFVILEPLDEAGEVQRRVGMLELFGGRPGVFVGVPAGSYNLRSYPASMAWQVDVEPNRTASIDVAGQAVELRCVVRRNGVPMGGCRVGVVADGEPMVVLKVTDAKGSFSLSGELAGSELLCRLQDRSRAVAFARVVAESESRLGVEWPSCDLDIQVGQQHPTALAVRVYAELVLGKRMVGVLDPAVRMVASRSLQRGFLFTLHGLAEGHYRVQLEDSKGQVVASATAVVNAVRVGVVEL